MQARDLFLAPDLEAAEISSFLESFGFRDPQRADQHLQKLTQLVGYPERLAGIAGLMLTEASNSADPDSAVAQFETFLEKTSNPLNLLSLLEENPRAAEVLFGILGGSPHLAQSLGRNPEYFYWLLERNRLETEFDLTYFRDQAAELTRPFLDSGDALDALRRLRRRESLRIGAQDILGRVGMEAVVQQVSDLAQALLEKAFDLLARDRLPDAQGFAVIALGKFGGRELNFSSDIDLLFVCGDLVDRREITRFSRDYLKALTEFTEEGHLYRVDLRLRPMGSTGQIVYSESAYRQYYQTWADTTDRLALIKARAVAGDPDLGTRFVDSVQDFIFKKYLDLAALEEIRWIKRRTDQALRKRNQELTNIKLGLGGIREIEFFAQSFQILYGASQPELRTPRTLEALQRLVDGGFIPLSDYEALSQAYVFFRNLEHKLQLVHDLQTHSLPDEDPALLQAARRMGYRAPTTEDTIRAFRADIERHSSAVRSRFDSLFESSHEAADLEELALNPALDQETACRRILARGIEDPLPVLEGIQVLLQAPAFPQSPSRMRNLLANLLPIVVEHAARSTRPRELFTRLDRFADSLGSRAALYSEMIENRDFAETLLAVLLSGPLLSETLIQTPELLDVLASVSVRTDFRAGLRTQLSVAPEAAEARRNTLRTFKRREEFKVAVEELRQPGHPEHRAALADLANACIEVAWEASLARYPRMTSERCVLIALGKLGGRELVFHSDLDLLFVFDDSGEATVGAADLRDFLRYFREELQQYTEAGRAYEVDFRLRPEGRHTGEAVPLSRLLAYFQERVEPWERLAWVKARPLLHHNLDLDLDRLAFTAPLSRSETAELLHIRRRKELELGREEKSGDFDLKVGRGALLDIQFVVQFTQIQHRLPEPNLLTALEKLRERGVLSEVEAETLSEATRFYFSLESAIDILGGDSARISRNPRECELLARRVGFSSGDALIEAYATTRDKVRALFEQRLA